MAALTTSLVIGMAISQGIGQLQQGNAARRAGAAQKRAALGAADLMDYNASVADLQAQDAIERGAIDAGRYLSQAREIIGGQRADYAAQGVDVSSGSALDVQADSAQLAELDARTIRHNAMREAWGYHVEAYDQRMRARLTRQEGINLEEAGRAQQTASRVAAVTTGVAAGGNLLMQRYAFRQATATTPIVKPAGTPSLTRGDVLVRPGSGYGGLA